VYGFLVERHAVSAEVSLIHPLRMVLFTFNCAWVRRVESASMWHWTKRQLGIDRTGAVFRVWWIQWALLGTRGESPLFLVTKEDQAIFPWHPSGLGLESTCSAWHWCGTILSSFATSVFSFVKTPNGETTKGNLASLFGSFQSTYIISESKMIIQCFPNVNVCLFFPMWTTRP
jgi:hypothetical protein